MAQYIVKSDEWTQISEEGQTIRVWLDQDLTDGIRSADVRIVQLLEGVAPNDDDFSAGRQLSTEPWEERSSGAENVVWARSKNPGDCKIVVQDWPNDVSVSDPHTNIVASPLLRSISTTALSAEFTIDTRTMTLPTGHGFTSGDFAVISGFYVGRVISSTTNSILLAARANLTFPAGTAVLRTSSSLLVDGSTTPVIFGIETKTAQQFDIYELRIAFQYTANADDGYFAGISGGITNGLIVRKKVNNTRYNNIIAARTNSGLRLYGDLEYNTKAPSGIYGMIYRLNFREIFGVTSRLSQDEGSRIELIVQDNLTGMSYGEASALGHVVGGI